MRCNLFYWLHKTTDSEINVIKDYLFPASSLILGCESESAILLFAAPNAVPAIWVKPPKVVDHPPKFSVILFTGSRLSISFDAFTEAAAEVQIEAVFNLAAEILSAVVLYAFDS